MEKDEKIELSHRQRMVWIGVIGIITILMGGTASMYGLIPTTTTTTSSSLSSTTTTKTTTKSVRGTESLYESGVHALETRVKELDEKVRGIKKNLERGVFMETDPVALAATTELQKATRALLKQGYGPYEPYRVRVHLEFPPSFVDLEEKGKDASILLEMGPSEYIPHSIFNFLELARQWPGGAFHRNVGHVQQVQVHPPAPIQHLAFQEYSEHFPHAKGTAGYAGRPSGPAWYVSTKNNKANHGPGSQQHYNPHEADSCFGVVIEGFEDVVLDRITKMDGEGFINDKSKQVYIPKMTILIKTSPDSDEYAEWSPSLVSTLLQ